MANYNGLITTVQHRLSSSFSLLANYTWSKCLNVADAQGHLAGTTVENPSNPGLDYGPCGSDFRNVGNIVLVTKSSFPLTGLTRLLLNNWEFAPLAHIVSGAPFTVTAGQDNSFTAVANDRPNLIGNPNNGPKRWDAWFNTAAFAPALPGSFGNAGRNVVVGPRTNSADFSVLKSTKIAERVNLQFRGEFFNIPNHPIFGQPGTSPGTSSYGVIGGTKVDSRQLQFGLKLNY